MRRTAHIQMVVAVVLTFNLGVGVSWPFALCSGPGGHIAIEPVHATCCRATKDAGSHHALASCAGAGAACTDLPLDNGPVLLRSSADQLQMAAAPIAVLPVVLGTSAGARAVHPSRVALIVLPPPRQQRTTILVC